MRFFEAWKDNYVNVDMITSVEKRVNGIIITICGFEKAVVVKNPYAATILDALDIPR